jgi:hypothetical protein
MQSLVAKLYATVRDSASWKFIAHTVTLDLGRGLASLGGIPWLQDVGSANGHNPGSRQKAGHNNWYDGLPRKHP